MKALKLAGIVNKISKIYSRKLSRLYCLMLHVLNTHPLVRRMKLSELTSCMDK